METTSFPRLMSGRRHFLQTVAGPWLLTGARAQSPSDRLNVLAIGVGGRGSGIALQAARLGAITACCDVDSAQSGAFAAKLSEIQKAPPEIYADYRKAFERKDIDVVTIGTPDRWHTPILMAALKAGKDVYCEKPMTLTIDEGKRICRAVKATRRVVQVGTQQRSEFDQRFLKAVAIARSGRLGRKLTATCYIGTGLTGGPYPSAAAPPTLDWDLWLGPAPKVEYTRERCHRTFRWWFEYSGGKMTDWGAHHIDIAQWALGAGDTGPVEILGEGHLPLGREATLAVLLGKAPAASLPNAYNTATSFKITLKFANGNAIVVQDQPGNGIRLEGENGQIWVSRKELTGPLVESIQSSGNEAGRLNEEVARLYGSQPAKHMERFFQCVRSRSTPVSDVFTHHRAMTSCHLCNISLLLNRKLKWDPKQEDFIGDREASALVARRQRSPYVAEG